MITMTNEQLEKIDLLDKLFGAFSVDQLREITHTEQVVAILKGDNQNPGLLKRLVQESDMTRLELQMAKSEILTLRTDLQTIIRVMVKPYDSYAVSEFSNLKSRNNVY